MPGAFKLPYVSVSPMMFETVIRDLLLVRCYRIQVYAREGNAWSLSAQVTRL
jgi:hypothetical protein